MKPGEHQPSSPQRVPAEMDGIWREIQSRLKESLGAHVFRSWLSAMRIVSFANGRLTLSCSSQFKREYIQTNFMDHLKLHWRQHTQAVRSIELVVEAERTLVRPQPTSARPASPQMPASSAYARTATRSAALLNGGMSMHTSRPQIKPAATAIGSTLPNPQYTFENFVVGTPNELAFASARHVAQEPGKRYSALYLHSASGFGKTHLLNAIGNEAMRLNSELKVAYMTAGTFMNAFGQATRDNDPMGFRDLVRSVDMLMLDDLQFIVGRDATFREFIATFKHLQDAGKQVIIAADRPASELEGIDEHARSRLSGALTVTIGPPDYTLRMAILKRKLADLRATGRVIEVSDNVLEYLAHKIDSNPRELEGALKCVANNAEIERSETSLEKVQELVRHLVKSQERRITIEDIQKKVSLFYHVSMRDLLSHRRDRIIVRPRQVAMYLCKEMTTRSLPEIGRRFGGRDHTTVLYGVRRIADMKKENAALSDEIDLLKRMIEA
ncbi:MAG TPA: chromosomal replication initiator protein DnaA [Alphaproteobacteria bacterium]|nr:chromosomal replication initiator protein DnaA [Alphaproteobacteria bacterium]